MARSGRQTQQQPRASMQPRISRTSLVRGRVEGEELPDPETLGLKSSLEVKIWLMLKKHGIPFRTQVNFDGGGLVYGEPRTDFVLLDRPVVVEGLGPWHDLPGAALRDDRKWEADRRSGTNLITIREVEAVTLEQCETNLMAKLGEPVVP